MIREIPKVDEIYTDPKFLEGFSGFNDNELEIEAKWIRKFVEESASSQFVFAELGAGYARWSVYAAAVLHELYPERHAEIIAVEAEPTHYQWMIEHMHNNGVIPFRTFNKPIAARNSLCLFQVGEPSEWYGQSIVMPCRWLVRQLFRGKRVHIARTVTLDTILADVGHVDVMDMDVQGQELKILSSASESTLNKIRILYIGTHSPWIEIGLRKLLSEKGWVMEEDIQQDPGGGFIDGIQIWRNPGWRER